MTAESQVVGQFQGWHGPLARGSRAGCACHNQNDPLPKPQIQSLPSTKWRHALALISLFTFLGLGVGNVFSPIHLWADSIVLKNGNKIQVDSVWEEGDRVHYIRGGGEYAIARSAVLRIIRSSGAPSSPTLGPSSHESSGGAAGLPAAGPASSDASRTSSVNQWVQSILPLDRRSSESPEALGDRLASLELQIRSHPNDDRVRHDWLHVISEVLGDRLANQDLPGAATLLKNSLAISPNEFSLMVRLGAVYLRLNEFKPAQQILRTAFQISPGSLVVNELLGMAEYYLSNNQLAIARWETALKISPQAPVAGLLEKVKKEEVVEKDFKFRHSAHFELSSDGKVVGSNLAKSVLDDLEQDYADFRVTFSVAPPGQIPVLLYPDQEFQQATNAPHDISGLNDGKIRIPVRGLTEVTPALEIVLKHELAHSFIQLKSQGHAPHWVHEGMAQYFSIPGVCDRQNPWWETLKQQSRLPIASLDDYLQPTTATNESTLAYLESLSLVCYISDTYGPDTLQQLLTALASTGRFDAAANSVLHDDLPDLERSWKNYLDRQGRL